MSKNQTAASEHTKEPWHLFTNRHTSTEGQPWGVIEAVLHPMGGAGQEPVGMTITWKGATGRANARRIVACVNACKGIETTRLEGMNIDAALYDSAFAFADEKNRADEATTLLEHSAPKPKASDRHTSACVKACEGIDLETLETLLDHGVTLNTHAPLAKARADEATALLKQSAMELKEAAKMFRGTDLSGVGDIMDTAAKRNRAWLDARG